MSKIEIIQALFFSIIAFCSSSRESEYVSNSNATANSIGVCFYAKAGVSRSCKTFENLRGVKEFIAMPYVKVEIRNQVLKKVHKYSFSRITYTKELIIRNCRLAEIEPGAFYASLCFLRFDLERNRLEVIKTGVFNDLLISHLNLGHNHIRTIEPDALSYMANLEEINLLNNHISAYDWKWFGKTPLLKSLNFQNNSIKELPEKAFRNLINRSHDLNLFFSFNRIRFIHPLAFENMKNTTIGKLYLDHNLLETWAEAPSMNINELEISFNNIKCIYGDLHATIKNNSLRSFVENPYNCDCLKEIKIIGDERGEHCDWFVKKYLTCRQENRHASLTSRGLNNNIRNITIFSSP